MKFINSLLILSIFVMAWGCGNGNKNNKIEASGNIEATNVVVSAKVNGQINKLLFEEGDKVLKGDTLLTIDHDILAIQLQQAKAARNAAEAQYTLLKQGARTEDVKQAADMLQQAKVGYQLAKTDFQRIENLYKVKSVTKKQYDDASARFNIAKSQYNSANENYKKIQNYARPEELKQAKANLDGRIAAVNLLKKRISDSYVIAPLNGFVVKKFIEAGENVAPMSSLLMISDLRYVDLVIYVPESELGKVQLGQSADVTVDSFKDKKFVGKVIYISPDAEFTPKNIQTKDERTKLVYAVKIHIHNPKFELKAGMPADAVINL